MANSDFVVNGRQNALKGIEAEVRPEIEARYADEWKRAWYVRRWILRRKINHEVAARIAERQHEAPAEALY